MTDLADDLGKVLERLQGLVSDVERLRRKVEDDDDDDGGPPPTTGAAQDASDAGPDALSRQPGEVTLGLTTEEIEVRAAMARLGLYDLLPVPVLSESGVQIWGPRHPTARRTLGAAIHLADLSELGPLPARLRLLSEAMPAERIVVVAEGDDATVRNAVRETMAEHADLLSGIEIRGLDE